MEDKKSNTAPLQQCKCWLTLQTHFFVCLEEYWKYYINDTKFGEGQALSCYVCINTFPPLMVV